MHGWPRGPNRSARWQQRLRDLLVAGGAVASAGCSHGADSGAQKRPVGCGNANIDPCICGLPDRDPTSKKLCDEKTACEARSGFWDLGAAYNDAGTPVTRCVCAPSETDPSAKAVCVEKLTCEVHGGSWLGFGAYPDGGSPESRCQGGRTSVVTPARDGASD